jgi:GTPase SAR1 family protein
MMSGFSAGGDRDAATLRVIEELKRLYKAKIQPLEQLYKFDMFHTPCISDAEFDSKPQVMLVGQYSVGKTTFIRYLLGRDFPSMRIGPEPTTDRFTALMDGPEERTIYGNSLAVMADQPYRGLQRFGNLFLQRFEGVQLPSPVLRNITLIDTPGVLSGEKQRVSRGYDFCQVCAWFATRADLIILLFDAHKLDISDEFKNTIDSLKGNDDKVRCILNKADQVDRQKLMRVYGALMWSIGKVVKTPEVMRVYIGSFWDQPLMCDDNAALFEMEERDLMRDLKDLPRNSAVRKINELVKRVRASKVHAYIVSYLKEQMPMFYSFEKKKNQLLDQKEFSKYQHHEVLQLLFFARGEINILRNSF